MSENPRSHVERAQKQVELHPGSAKAHFNLGLAHSKRGALKPAEAAYRKALELDADLVEAWVNLGGVLMLRWDFKGSLEVGKVADLVILDLPDIRNLEEDPELLFGMRDRVLLTMTAGAVRYEKEGAGS